MNQANLNATTATIPLASTAQNGFDHRSRVSANSFLASHIPSVRVDIPPSHSPSPSPSPSSTPPTGMSKHSTAHDEWAGPIPSNTLRNSMSLHRPAFVHSSTNYHTTNANASASGSTSSLPLPPSPTTSTTNLNSHTPYRDHPLTTKEEYPNADPSTNPYAQVFPPHRSSARRQGPNGYPQHVRQSSFSAWDGVRCRLSEIKCKLCSKEGALGRGLMIGWVLTTVGFLVACAFWKGELFTALDDLSKELYSLGYQGQLIFGFLIFLTTIPPLPLYSTLMVLCGYTFGVWQAFVVSYIASLVGAVTVFIISRTLLRDVITKSLQNSPTAMSLLHIIPSKPHLLLLIRVAPYPYNLLNVILASSPSLSLRTYTACTALSLCKLVLHTWIGAGLHDLSELHGGGPGHGDGSALSVEDQQRQDVRWYSTCFGVVLCISLFFYLTHLAKRAVAKAQSEHEAREVRCPGQGHLFLREDA